MLAMQPPLVSGVERLAFPHYLLTLSMNRIRKFVTYYFACIEYCRLWIKLYRFRYCSPFEGNFE